MRYIFFIIVVISYLYSGDTFYDKSTKLFWQDVKNSKEYTYKSSGFSTGAFEYCKELELGNYNDWRLPTVKELMTLVDITKHSPASIEEIKHVNYNNNYRYFTSDSVVADGLYPSGYMIDFQDGSIKKIGERNNMFFKEKGYVRCVRIGRNY